MLRFIPVLALLLFTACGLAENEQDDKNKRIYITFTDPPFVQFCLGLFDLDHVGRISRYEAQRVVRIDCSGRGIASLADVAEFANLRELDCRGNDLVRLLAELATGVVSYLALSALFRLEAFRGVTTIVRRQLKK